MKESDLVLGSITTLGQNIVTTVVPWSKHSNSDPIDWGALNGKNYESFNGAVGSSLVYQDPLLLGLIKKSDTLGIYVPASLNTPTVSASQEGDIPYLDAIMGANASYVFTVINGVSPSNLEWSNLISGNIFGLISNIFSNIFSKLDILGISIPTYNLNVVRDVVLSPQTLSVTDPIIGIYEAFGKLPTQTELTAALVGYNAAATTADKIAYFNKITGDLLKAEVGDQNYNLSQPATAEFITNVYHNLFNRQPDLWEVHFWQTNKTSAVDLVNVTTHSPEFFTTNAESLYAYNLARIEGNSYPLAKVDGEVRVTGQLDQYPIHYHVDSGGGGGGGGGGAFCDRRLKTNIRLLSRSVYPFNVYGFNYIGDDRVFIGPMAQELLADERYCHMVSKNKYGFYQVDFRALGINHLASSAMMLAGKEALQKQIKSAA